MQLALLFLRSISFDLGHDGAPATAFLVNMNTLFEDFVVAALRDALRVSPHTLRHGDRTLRLAEDGRVVLEPDISWWEGGHCRFVGDVKYKRIWPKQTAPNADLYQLLAYTVAAGVPEGLLIYAAGDDEQPATHHIRHAGKRLEVRTLDLNTPPEVLLAQIAGIAAHVRTMR